MLIKYLIVFFVTTIYCLHTAQAQFVLEKEYAQKIDQSGALAPYVFFLEQYGILLAQRESVSSTFFAMRCLNTQLVMKWQSRQDLPFFAYTNIQRYFDREHGYFYLMAQNIPPTKKATLLKIDLNSGSMTYEEQDLNVLCTLVEFKVVNDNLFMHVLREEQPAVLLKQAGENAAKVLPMLFDNAIRLLQIQEDFISNALYFFSYNHQKLENNMVLYSNLVGFQKTPKLFDNSQYILNNFQLKSFESKQKLIVGTFAQSLSGTGLGIFSKVFDPNTNDPGKFRYFRFVEMPSIYAHLPEKRQAKIRAKFTRKADYGKEPKKIFKQMSFRTELYNFKPDEVVLAVEGTYENTNNPVVNIHTPNFGRKTYPRQVTLLGFDTEGKKLWDNHLIFENLISTTEDHIVNPRLQIGALGDSLVLAYFSQTGLTSKLIHQANTVNKEVFQTYKSLFPTSFYLDSYYHFERLEENLFVLQGDYSNPVNGETLRFLRLMRYVPSLD